VQEELGRIVVTANRGFKELFDANHPYPTCWPDVSDALLLRILFGIHGPRSANDAKTRLELRPFFFNDSTTYQDQFCGKLRKFNSNFKTTLADFSYSSHKWPIDDQLTKEMIRDAYVKCLSSTETIKNPAGAMVPKCHNLAMCRELIRQKKSLPLEEIMDFLTDYFDHQDSVIRSTQGLSYLVTPWNVQGKKAQKRGFNQLSTPGPNQGASKAAKPPDHLLFILAVAIVAAKHMRARNALVTSGAIRRALVPAASGLKAPRHSNSHQTSGVHGRKSAMLLFTLTKRTKRKRSLLDFSRAPSTL
jgi:hypothetical protein